MSTRIVVVDSDRCQPNKCNLECKKSCPVVSMGKLCIEVTKQSKIATVSETLCNGCNICTKTCPFKALKIINLPTKLVTETAHRYGQNGFKMHKFPNPRRGQVLGLVGNNGIGKSTCMKILSGGLIPNFGFENEATSDEILNHFRGSEIQQFFLDTCKTKASYKMQVVDAIPQKYSGTIRNILSDDNSQAVKYRTLFELNHLLDRTVGQLSGGELQRFACAVACSKETLLYLFDEPSSYLDIKQRIIMADTLLNLRKDSNYVVVVEHDLSIMDYLSDFVNVFYGTENVYGVVSDPFNVRDGINIYLDGYLPSENMRFRDYNISFNLSTDTVDEKRTSYHYEAIEHKNGSFTLNVEAGQFNTSEIIVLLGQNGTGKTSLVRLLASNAIISDSLSISYKPQIISPKFTGTVKQLLQLKIAVMLTHSQFRADVLVPFNIEDIYDIPVQQLSGGQLQKVAIVLCLGKPADIYLLDEPSSYLDSEQRIIMAKVIKRFIMHSHKTAFVVEHDFMVSTYLADKVIIFSGQPGITTTCSQPMLLNCGMNMFLKDLGVTIRKDKSTGRPRINKKDSVLEKEQITSGKYWE